MAGAGQPLRPRRRAAAVVAGLLLSAVTALVAAGGEAAMYGLFTGIDPMRVLRANLMFGFGPRPAWIVLGAGLAVTVLAGLRRLQKSPARRRAVA